MGSSVITPEDVLETLMNDGTIDAIRLKIINQLKANEELKNTTITMVEQSKVLNTPGAERQTKRELFDALRQELETPVLEKASKSVWELILDNDGLGKEISETVEKVYCRLSGQELPLFPQPNSDTLQPEKEKEKEEEEKERDKEKGKDKEKAREDDKEKEKETNEKEKEKEKEKVDKVKETEKEKKVDKVKETEKEKDKVKDKEKEEKENDKGKETEEKENVHSASRKRTHSEISIQEPGQVADGSSDTPAAREVSGTVSSSNPKA